MPGTGCRGDAQDRGHCLITADHGNVEQMFDPASRQAHTAHTTNPVPLIYVGGSTGTRLRNGRLCDIAPTILKVMELPKPDQMSGECLIQE